MPYAWPSHGGMLHIGGVSIDAIAAQFDTPCYVTDAAVIRARYRDLVATLQPAVPVTMAYACKANTNLALLAVLAKEGAAFDVVSPGEAEAVLRVGVPPARIMFTGTNPRTDEITWLADRGIMINCDALSVAQRIAPRCTPRAFSVRISPTVGAGHHDHVVTGGERTQFGVRKEELAALLDLLHAHGHRLTRLHAHIGSGVLDASPFHALIEEMADVAARCARHPAAAIDTIDLGGGLGIPYAPDTAPLDLAAFGRDIATRFRAQCGPDVTLMMEPGRFFVAESTLLLARVTTIKPTRHETFLGLDAGLHTLLRPALYGAYHHIIAPTQMDRPADTAYTICGPICETADIFGRDRRLPAMQEGDLVALCDTGAYGFAMSSTYNSHPRPAEVLVLDGTAHLIRQRESMEQLFTGQVVPPGLG